MATMDPDTIPSEPTTDFEPPATSVVTGPSLDSTSPAADRRRGSMIQSSGDRARPGRDVQRRDRGRTPGDARLGHGRDDDPGSHRQRGAGLRPHPRGVGRPPHQVRRRRPAQRQGPHLRRDQRHDPGRRRHRPHLLPDPRGTRPAIERPVRPVRRDRRPDRHRRGRPAAHRRRLPQESRGHGRPGGR